MAETVRIIQKFRKRGGKFPKRGDTWLKFRRSEITYVRHSRIGGPRMERCDTIRYSGASIKTCRRWKTSIRGCRSSGGSHQSGKNEAPEHLLTQIPLRERFEYLELSLIGCREIEFVNIVKFCLRRRTKGYIVDPLRFEKRALRTELFFENRFLRSKCIAPRLLMAPVPLARSREDTFPATKATAAVPAYKASRQSSTKYLLR